MENNLKILVLEDETPLLEAINKKLTDNKFSVLKARSVEEAEEYFKNNTDISAIWLDHYLLGKKNGLDFVHDLKASDKTKNIPIFVVSNTASPEKTGTYLNLGVNKYYTKADHRLEDIISDIKKELKNE